MPRPMNKLSVTLVQTDLAWHDPGQNRRHFQRVIADLREPTDLIVLPEMFTTGFTMEAHTWAESMDGETLGWMAEMARQAGAAVCGSLIIGQGGRYWNRLVWMPADGNPSHYDKRHLFAMAGEHHHFEAGDERLIVDLQGWRVCPLVCYDLRFPVWSRNRDDYDLLIYVANWPSRRREHWRLLLKARAIENQCYVVGVNRIGRDARGNHYAGDSAVIEYSGAEIISRGGESMIATIKLDRDALSAYREQLPFLRDADLFGIDGTRIDGKGEKE